MVESESELRFSWWWSSTEKESLQVHDCMWCMKWTEKKRRKIVLILKKIYIHICKNIIWWSTINSVRKEKTGKTYQNLSMSNNT